jgi:hypothetical protein
MAILRFLKAVLGARVSIITAIVLSLAAGLSAAPVVRAQAILPIVNCTGNHAATWSPGVTNTTALHTVTTDTAWSCTQLIALPLLTSASSHEQFTAPFNCTNLFSTAPITWTLHWSDARGPATSTFTFTATVAPVDGNLVVTAPGSITGGRYAGRGATAVFTLLNLGATLNDQCNSATGVTSASGPSTFLIL